MKNLEILKEKEVKQTVKMESKEKEMPKICINDIEWEHLIKKYHFSSDCFEIYGNVNENNIENIFNILQECDKNDEESFQVWGYPYTRRVVDNTFQIYVDVVYFKEEIDKSVLVNTYELTFLKKNDDIKLISVGGEGEVNVSFSDVVCQDWKRDIYPYQNHINKLLDEAWEKNKILVEKCNNNEITWVEVMNSLN